MTMNLDILIKGGELYLQNGFWKIRFLDDQKLPYISGIPDASGDHYPSHPIWIGIGTGPKGLTRIEAEEVAHTILLTSYRRKIIAESHAMTVADFVEKKFVPGHVFAKTAHGRLYYRSMLRHIIEPHLVVKMFSDYMGKSAKRAMCVEGWPYIGHVPLRQVQSGCIRHLIAAACEHGYSRNTALNIRDTVKAIFSYATKQSCFDGTNPASGIQLAKEDIAPVYAERK